MASSKQEGTSAAAEQLGSLSLGESAERKDKNNEDAEENEVPTTLCSACGEKSDALMKCRACKCVWYCDKDCQNKHWKSTKKNASPSRSYLTNVEASSISAKSWMLGLFPTYRRGGSAQSACMYCRFTTTYKHTIHAVARLSAAVAIISTK